VAQITGKFILNGTVTLNKLNQDGATTNQVITWNGSQWVPGNVINPLSYRMTATQATTSTTYGTLTELTSGSLPTGNYRFTATIRAQSAALATGMGFRIGSGSATLSNVFANWRIPTGTNFGTSSGTGYSQLTATDNAVSGGVPAANTDLVAIGMGFFTVDAQGTVAIQFRSENGGTAITAGIGSNFIIDRLP
jgi:hypothetical protein